MTSFGKAPPAWSFQSVWICRGRTVVNINDFPDDLANTSAKPSSTRSASRPIYYYYYYFDVADVNADIRLKGGFRRNQ